MTLLVLNISKLSKSFGEDRILNQVSLSVNHGDVFVLLGPNGSGKTTMINCVLSLLNHDAGEIKLFGEYKNVQSNKRMGVLMEQDGFFQDMSVEKNLKIVCLIKRVPFEAIPEVLNKVSLFEHRKKRIKKLSQGMRKRLAIACSLVGNPDLLIWDEPYNSLDPPGFKLVRQLVEELNNQGKTLFISTHLLDEAKRIGTRVGLIHQGVMKEVMGRNDIDKKYTTMDEFFFHHIFN